MGTEIVRTAATFTDPGVLWQEIYDTIKAALAPIGAYEAIDQIARAGASYAVKQYNSAIEFGTPPGIARQDAVATGKVWIESEAKKNNIVPVVPGQDQGAPSGTGTSEVNNADVKSAVDAYREGITSGQEERRRLVSHVIDPAIGSSYAPVQASTVSAPERLTAAMQRQVTVGSADLTGMRESAQGRGAVTNLAAARLQQALRAGANQASGIAMGATGAARKGAARTGVLAANQAALDAGSKVAELQASTTLQAQGQLATLEQQRESLQAQLDQARAAGDQNAINDITKKMADLTQRAGEFNASQEQTAATTRNDQGLAVETKTEEARVANERLKLDAQKALEESAKGLLDEAQREATLAMARQQLDLAERRFQQEVDQAAKEAARADREFWAKTISSLVTGAATAVTAASDRRAKKDIEPVKDADLGELAQAVRKSLATWKYKKETDGPPGERAGPMAQDLEGTRLGRAVTSEREDGTKQVNYAQLATLLAAATVKARKREAV